MIKELKDYQFVCDNCGKTYERHFVRIEALGEVPEGWTRRWINTHWCETCSKEIRNVQD